MKKYVQVITATEARENAEKIARELVQNHLAACVQIIGPFKSVYRWKDEIEEATEWLCIAKTRRDLYKKVEASILRNHTYEIPEILVIPVAEGSEDYISWLDNQLGG